MTFYTEKHELFDGDCLLYRRTDKTGVNPVWQMRLKVGGLKGYVRLSCKTKDYAKACVSAKKQLDDLNRKVSAGVPIKSWSFARHWDDWFNTRSSTGAWAPSREMAQGLLPTLLRTLLWRSCAPQYHGRIRRRLLALAHQVLGQSRGKGIDQVEPTSGQSQESDHI